MPALPPSGTPSPARRVHCPFTNTNITTTGAIHSHLAQQPSRVYLFAHFLLQHPLLFFLFPRSSRVSALHFTSCIFASFAFFVRSHSPLHTLPSEFQGYPAKLCLQTPGRQPPDFIVSIFHPPPRVECRTSSCHCSHQQKCVLAHNLSRREASSLSKNSNQLLVRPGR